MVQTPHLDSLAARGVRFTRAYTNSPICVAARAALASGRYVHQTGHWDNAFPYHGEVPSWMHRVRNNGNWMQSIGKLHFRSKEDDNGFSDEHEPLHVAEGIGEIIECLRDKAPPPVTDRLMCVRPAPVTLHICATMPRIPKRRVASWLNTRMMVNPGCCFSRWFVPTRRSRHLQICSSFTIRQR